MLSMPHREDEPYFITRKPAGPLARYIEMIWIWRGAQPTHSRDRMMPGLRAHLIFNLAEDEIRCYSSDGKVLEVRHEGASFGGPRIEPHTIDTAEQMFVAGVSFLPGGAYPFVHSAQDELCNVLAPLRDVWGLDVASLREQLLIQPSPMAALARLERALVEQVKRPLERHPAVTFALKRIEQDPMGVRIKDIGEDCTLSQRRLARLFELEIGVTPKVYARMVRFKKVRELVHTRDQVDWSEVALDCGYYDQSHLNRDFKLFSGFAPTEYARQATGLSDHVPIF